MDVMGADHYLASFPETTDPRAMAQEVTPKPPVAPGSRGTLVYGEIGYELHLLPVSVAEYYAECRQALKDAQTWGEFRDGVSAKIFVATMRDLGKEQPPGADESFDPETFDQWLGWPAEEDPPWAPKEIIDAFGCINVPMHDAAYTYFDLDEKDDVVAAFEAHGFLCEPNSILIDEAFGQI